MRTNAIYWVIFVVTKKETRVSINKQGRYAGLLNLVMNSDE